MARRKKRDIRAVGKKWTYERSDAEKERRRGADATFRMNPLDSDIYDPPQDRRISSDGAWVMILRTPFAFPKRFRFQRGQIFFATHEDGADEFGFMASGDYKIRITTPWGQCCLWPYEYSVMDPASIMPLKAEGELEFIPFTKNAVLNDQVFYLRSRGIPLNDAMVMTLGTLKSAVGWFRPSRKVARELEVAFG